MTNNIGTTTPRTGSKTVSTTSQSSPVGKENQSNQKGKEQPVSPPKSPQQTVQDRIALTNRPNSNKNQNVPDEETKPTAPIFSSDNVDVISVNLSDDTITNGIFEGSETISNDLTPSNNLFINDVHDVSCILSIIDSNYYPSFEDSDEMKSREFSLSDLESMDVSPSQLMFLLDSIYLFFGNSFANNTTINQNVREAYKNDLDKVEELLKGLRSAFNEYTDLDLNDKSKEESLVQLTITVYETTNQILRKLNNIAFLSDEQNDSNLLRRQLVIINDIGYIDTNTRELLYNITASFNLNNKEDMRKLVLMIMADFYGCERSKKILEDRFGLVNTDNIANDIKILGRKICSKIEKNRVNLRDYLQSSRDITKAEINHSNSHDGDTEGNETDSSEDNERKRGGD